MPITIHCPACGQQYQVADGTAGQSVRCQKCGGHFQAIPAPGTMSGAMNPLAYGPGWNMPRAAIGRARVSNPSGGPTDAGMRLAGCGMLGIAVLMIIGSVVLNAFTGTVYMFVVGLVPLLLVVGVTVLISPNVIRAAGKYGGHLPGHYKVIGWGVIGFGILLMLPLMVLLHRAGFRPDVPRPRPQFQGELPAGIPQAPPIAGAPAAPAGAVPPAAAAPAHAAPAAQAAPGAMKPRKAYPMTIAVPDHSAIVPADAKIPPGTKLEACYSDRWHPITTLSENDDGSLNVRWDTYGPVFDCSMVRGELIIRKDLARQLGVAFDPNASVPPPVPAAPPTAGGAQSKPLKAYPVTITIPADSQVVPADAKLPPGTRLQACWANQWNPITLLSENTDGTLTVRWDDFGPDYDCRMVRGELIVKVESLR
jgi:predicted Zn finger-like uncharacterized protein